MIAKRSSEVVAPSCLVCGTLSPDRETPRASPLHAREGWYSWRSEQDSRTKCLCPACQSRPDQVAKSIMEREGLGPMVEWLRGWKAAS
jgi:hypothetical protein